MALARGSSARHMSVDGVIAVSRTLNAMEQRTSELGAALGLLPN